MATPVNATTSPYSYEEMKNRQRSLGPTGPTGPLGEDFAAPAVADTTSTVPADVLNQPALPESTETTDEFGAPVVDEFGAPQLNMDEFGAPTIKPKEQAPSFGDRALAVAKGVGEMAKFAAPFVIAEAPGMLPAAAKIAGPLASAGLATHYGVKILGDYLAGHKLEKTLSNLPSLQPEHIHVIEDKLIANGVPEDRRKELLHSYIQNIAAGRAQTAESLVIDIKGVAHEGIGNTATLGAAVLTNPIAAKLPRGKAAVAGTVQSARQMVAQQAAAGAKAIGIFNALTTTGEVIPEMAAGDMNVKGALSRIGLSAVEGAVMGAVVGPTLGAFSHGSRVAANNKIIADLSRQQAIQKFVDDFKPEWVGTRFRDDMVGSPEDVARNILSKTLNMDPASVPSDALTAMTAKVESFNTLQEKSITGLASRVYPELPVKAGPATVENIAQPIGEPLTSEGGIAPEPGLAPKVQGPLGEQPAPFEPPTVKPVAGLESEPVSASAPPEPIVPERAPAAVPEPQVVPVVSPAEPVSPRGIEPASVQGPIGERQPEFTPPTGVRPAAGIEKAPTVEYRGEGPRGFVNLVNALGTPKTGKPGIRVIDGVDVKVAPSTDGKSVRIESIRAAEPQKGAGTKVMQRLAAEADQSGTPLEVLAQPAAVKKGGRIPLPKLKAWYESHGFQSVEESENYAIMRRSPVAKMPVAEPVVKVLSEDGPAIAERVKGVEAENAVQAAGNVVEGKPLIRGQKPVLSEKIEKQLDLFSKAAEERLNKKGTRLTAGFDPTDLTDYAIIGAARMFKLGMRSKKAFTEAMTKLYGEVIAPHINDIYAKALKILQKSISGGPTQKQLDHLMKLAESGRHGMNWYEQTAKWAKNTFGEDADMFTRFMAATSADSSTETGSSLALKAYTQWKLGLPFDGMRSKSMVMNLDRAVRGEQFGGDKIDSFYRALRGDADAVVLDRWMMRALGFKNTGAVGGKGSFGGVQYRMFSEIVRDLSEQANMTPRQFQAAIWEGARIKNIHSMNAKGGARLATKVGSAKPLDQLVQERLGDMTPIQWVDANALQAGQLRNISDGLRAAREQGGYTFNPFTWETDKTPGFIVTLASDVVPKKEFYSSALVDFRRQFARHIDASAFGDMMRGGQHLSVGTWNMGEAKPDHFSLDLNITLPESMREQAMKIGLENKQFEVGHVDPQGNFMSFKTGYDPAVHGKQDLPPAKGPARTAWFKEANARVGSILDGIGSYTMPATTEADGTLAMSDGALQYMVKNPATALSHAAEVLGKTQDEMHALIDAGKFRPMTDAGVAGAAFVTKDGTVWRYVDPKGPSYNTTEMVGTLRGKNLVPMLDKLKGMEVIDGHEVIDSYRSQAGFTRIARPAPAAKTKAIELATAMTKTGGTVLPLNALDKPMYGANSLWLLPNGRIINSPTMHARHAERVLSKLRMSSVKGYAGGAHGAGSDVQALLNMGAIRMQASGEMVGFDLSARITDAQRTAMRRAIASHSSWGAQISNEKGELISQFGSWNSDKPHHFLAKAGGEGE